jgi:pimeloyl-ACP methyl ester carboxylesterase
MSLSLHHVDSGGGEPLLLIHGVTATHRYWLQNIPHLAQRRRVLAVDLPGFGRSHKPDASYSISWFVDELARFLDEKGVERAHLCGNSLGGLIAMAFALQHPRRVDKLILVDPAGVTRLPLWLGRVVMRLVEGGAGSLGRRMPRVPSPVTQALFRAVFPTRPDLAARYIRSYEKAIASDEYPLHLRSAFRAVRGVLGSPMRKRAREIGAPTLIFWGARDYLLPVTAARALRQSIPHSRLVIYSQSGHCPMVDQPDRWNRDVEAFLDGYDVGR